MSAKKSRKLNVASIRFPHLWLERIRNDLLNDLSREHFCILLGKKSDFENGYCINIIDVINPGSDGYISNSLSHVSPRKELIHFALSELTNRFDVDTLIDVHTHPFSKYKVQFSGVDDDDEINFHSFIEKNFGNEVNYASIVFSQQFYQARRWVKNGKKSLSKPLSIRPQTPIEKLELIQSKDVKTGNGHALDRSIRALGVKTISDIVSSGYVSVIGVGGIGSVICENLIHMGFSKIILIDHDKVEHSNLNRIVGAKFNDAEGANHKVDSVKNHLLEINPNAEIIVFKDKIENISNCSDIANSEFILIATDNHSSRFYAQQIAFNYFIPMISAGVSIEVKNGEIFDYSGEVITVRVGDRICLNCLGRLNPTKIAAEQNQFAEIGEKLVDKGYVKGLDVREPAVKTLNSVIGALAVEELVNQFTQRTENSQILVYERNRKTSIFNDMVSLENRNKNCATCCIV